MYDASGGVLPGVAVTLTDATGAAATATTNAAGQFVYPVVQPGHYLIEASLPGFRTLRHEFDLARASDWDRVYTLQVGTVRETVTVTESRVAAPAPSSQPHGPEPVRVGGNIRAPRKEGVVPIEAVIGRDGTVISVRVTSAQVHPDFAIAAVDAVRQWRFTPTLLNGQAIDVVMNVSVTFRLSE
jgi:TonB family protein